LMLIEPKHNVFLELLGSMVLSDAVSGCVAMEKSRE
jgi:hypothetical protein